LGGGDACDGGLVDGGGGSAGFEHADAVNAKLSTHRKLVRILIFLSKEPELAIRAPVPRVFISVTYSDQNRRAA
jgi:hypothetical protein